MKLFRYRNGLIEIFLIILNISLFNTVIPSIIFGNWQPYIHQLFIFIINICYLICKGKMYLSKVRKTNILLWIIVFILVIIFALEIPRYFVGCMRGTHLLKTLLSGFGLISFWLVMSNIYSKRKFVLGAEDAISSIIKPYVYVCLIIASLSNFVFLLWQLNIVDLFQNPIPANFSTFIDNNTINYGASYFSPLNITIVTAERRLGSLATFCGISYEPHIAAYFATPAMFLLHGITDISKLKKILYTTMFIVFLFTAQSGTNALMLIFLILLMAMKPLFIDRKFMLTFLLVIFIIGGLLYGLNNINDIYVLKKIASRGDSADYSINFLTYAISPTTLWGDGVFNVPYPYADIDNIGLFFSLLIISFYSLGYLGSFKAIFQRNILTQYVGFAALYFFLHSLKIVQLIFVFPFTVFILFLLLRSFDLIRPGKVQKQKMIFILRQDLRC